MLDRWFEDAKSVITGPSEFFQRAEQEGFGWPLKFAVISILIAGVLNLVRSVLFSAVLGQGSGLAIVGGLIGLLGTVLGGILGLLITAGLIHIFVALFGGEGYGRTLSILEYATALSPLQAVLAFIPVVGPLAGALVGLYGLYVEFEGLKEVQGLSTGKAILAVILPVVLIIVLAVVLVLTAGLSLLAAATG